MLITDSVRGVDGTGIYGVSKNGGVRTYKYGGEPFHILFNKSVQEQLLAQSDKFTCFVGHNRWATTGKVNNQNAHPFREGSITLVHNGSARSTKRIEKKGVEVDSHMICHSINEKGMEAFKDIDSSFALVWHDKKDNSINIARNNERPLHYSILGNSLYLASEAKMLEWLLDRNGVKNPIVVEFTVRKHYKIYLSEKDLTLRIMGDIEYYDWAKDHVHFPKPYEYKDYYHGAKFNKSPVSYMPTIGLEYFVYPVKDKWYYGEMSKTYYLDFQSPLFGEKASFEVQCNQEEYDKIKDLDSFIIKTIDRTPINQKGHVSYLCRSKVVDNPDNPRQMIGSGETLSLSEKSMATCCKCEGHLRLESVDDIYLHEQKFFCGDCMLKEWLHGDIPDVMQQQGVH